MEILYNQHYEKENEAYQKRLIEAKECPGKYTKLTWKEAMHANDNRSRFLEEIAIMGDVRGLPGLSSRERRMFHKEAEQLGLCHQTAGGLCGTLVIGKQKEHVLREVNRINAKIAAEERAQKDKREAERVARQRELDDMHCEIIKLGDDGDVGGIWSLELPTFFTWGNPEWTWDIAGPHQAGYLWGKYGISGSGVLKIEWGDPSIWRDAEKALSWREVREYFTEEDLGDYAVHSLETCRGTVTFTSSYTCRGVWTNRGREYEFTGRKISKKTMAAVDKCYEAFEKSTETILEGLSEIVY